MAPKKPQAAAAGKALAAKRGSRGAAAPGVSGAPAPGPPAAGSAALKDAVVQRADNTAYFAEVKADVECVLAHLVDLRGKLPLGLGRGGSSAVFDKTVMSTTFASLGEYICSVNLCWLSLESANPELPLSLKKKASLTAAYYQNPVKCRIMDIGIDQHTDVAEVEKMIQEGRLPVCFPVEHLHAWWAGFATAVRSKADEDVLSAWETAALTSVVQFRHCTKDGVGWRAMQAREDISTDFEALRCTPLMRVINFGAFKNKEEAMQGGKLSANELLTRYKSHLNLSARSEKLTAGWVDMACTFLNRMYNIPAVAKILNDADDLPAGTNPLEGTSKLQAIIGKAKTADKICLTVEHIYDMHRSGMLSSPPPLSLYTGSGNGMYGKGLVDLILYKWEVAHYIMSDWATGHAFGAEAVVEMKKILGSISSYRKQCGYPNQRVDMTFRAGWAVSSEELFTFIEALLFDTIYDPYLKEALQKSAHPADAVANHLNEYLDAIAAAADANKD